MAMSAEESLFCDPKTGLCRYFEPKAGKMLVVNVDESIMFSHYTAQACFRGNKYAPYCDFCAKDICLYYKPEVNLVPEGQDKVIILNSDEVEKHQEYLSNK